MYRNGIPGKSGEGLLCLNESSAFVSTSTYNAPCGDLSISENNFLRQYYLMNHVCLFEKSLLRGEMGYAILRIPKVLRHFSTALV